MTQAVMSERESEFTVCLCTLSLQCSGSVLVNISLRGGANSHYVRLSSTVNCQPFVCFSIHLIANNHYSALSSWQMIDVVLMSDGWPCHSDVQACIKNNLYEKPVSLIKQTSVRVHALMLRNAGTQVEGKSAKRKTAVIPFSQTKTKVHFYVLAENVEMRQDLRCDG